MSGHGHVKPNANGTRARCGGPAICSACAREYLGEFGHPFVAASTPMTAPSTEEPPTFEELVDILIVTAKWRDVNEPNARTAVLDAYAAQTARAEAAEAKSGVKLAGYIFSAARVRDVWTGRYDDWGPDQFSFSAPEVFKGSIRNVRPVFEALQPPAAALGGEEAT